MATLWCPDGEHTQKVAFKPSAGERFCPEHRCALRPIEKQKAAPKQRWEDSGLQRLEDLARVNFGRIVTGKRCFLSDVDPDGTPRRPDHICTFPLDPHHLVEVQWMRRELVLPPEDLIAVMFNPIIGCPLCRGGHALVELRVAEFIYWPELRLETIEFCELVDAATPEGTPSMLGRLEIESPKRDLELVA